jgi:hypothetical protein
MCWLSAGRLGATPDGACVRKIRVVTVVTPPRLLPNIVSELLAEAPGIELVASAAGDDDLSSVVRQAMADVVVVAEDAAGLPLGCARLLTEFPRLRVVSIQAGATEGCVRRDGDRPLTLGELSLPRLLAAIRGSG